MTLKPSCARRADFSVSVLNATEPPSRVSSRSKAKIVRQSDWCPFLRPMMPLPALRGFLLRAGSMAVQSSTVRITSKRTAPLNPCLNRRPRRQPRPAAP